MRTLLIVLMFGVALPAAGKHPAVEVVDYVVKKGDTCASIAKDFYGDGTRYDVIHAYNPQLGPALPHRHEVGDTLRLPPQIPPDAWVTAVTRRVEHRSARADWAPSKQGTALRVGFRVSTHDESAAELVFEDDTLVELRENTLLVIFGRSAKDARAEPNRARLERGTLRARLAELRGAAPTPDEPAASGLQIESAAAVASFSDATALMSVDPEDGLAAVSNHGGGEIQVASSGNRGAKVAVPDGMGTRVARGRAPEPPRPLPAAPAWVSPTTQTAWGATGPAASATLAWAPVEAVAAWRVELWQGGAVFAAMPLPAHRREARLLGLPAGDYSVTVSTQGQDGLTSKPSAPLALTVRGLEGGETLPPAARIGGCVTPGAPPGPATVLPEAAGEITLQCGGRTLTVQVGEGT